MGLGRGVFPVFFLPNKRVLLEAYVASGADGTNAHVVERMMVLVSSARTSAALEESLIEVVAMVRDKRSMVFGLVRRRLMHAWLMGASCHR